MGSTSAVVDGETVMLNPRSNRREKSRTLLILPVSIGLGYAQHQGIIRDVSASGMFLYSDFTPPLGAEIELKLLPPTPTKRSRLTYRAIVVRLTAGVAGAAVGMGLSLIGMRPGAALQSLGAALRLREIANQPAYPLKQGCSGAEHDHQNRSYNSPVQNSIEWEDRLSPMHDKGHAGGSLDDLQ